MITGQLIEQIKKLAIAFDPDWARRRYEQALADRKVVGYRNADGSANLSGVNLPIDRVAEASGRIDALAKTVKRAGDLRPIDHIRADLFLGMTDGTYAGLDDAEITDQLLAASRDAGEGDGDPCDGGRDAGDGGAEDAAAAGTEPPVPGAAVLGAGMELRGNQPHGGLTTTPYPHKPCGYGPRFRRSRRTGSGFGAAPVGHAPSLTSTRPARTPTPCQPRSGGICSHTPSWAQRRHSVEALPLVLVGLAVVAVVEVPGPITTRGQRKRRQLPQDRRQQPHRTVRVDHHDDHGPPSPRIRPAPPEPPPPGRDTDLLTRAGRSPGCGQGLV